MLENIVKFFEEGSFSVIPAKLVIAFITFLIGAIIAKAVSSILLTLLREVEVNRIVHKASKKSIDISLIISKAVKYTIYLIFFVIALNELGITSIVLYSLVGFALLVILITFFLGARDFIPNLFAGLFMLKHKEIKKGDSIRSGEISGTVEETGIIETKIRTSKGEYVFVPNSSLIRRTLIIKKESRNKTKK